MKEPVPAAAPTSNLSDRLDAARPLTSRIQAMAGRLGCTEGQLYSMAIALPLASALVIFGGVPLGTAPRAGAAAGIPTPTPGVVIAPSPVPSHAGAVPTPGPLGPVPLPSLQAGQQSGPESVPTPIGTPSSSPWSSGVGTYRVPSPGAPAALTFDAASVYVGTDNAAGSPSRLVVFSRTGDQARTLTITGQPTGHAGGLSAAALHGADVLVTDRSRGALLQIDPRTQQQKVLAQLPDLPPCLVGITGTCQPGAQDQPPMPEGLAVAGPYAYIADAAQGTIWRYTFATRQLTAWYSSSDFSAGSGPSGLALDPAGNLVFTVAETADPAALLKGALYRLEVSTTGAPGARSLLASFASGATPGPVAIGRSGDIYVGLRGAGGIVVVRPNGTVTALAAATATRVPAPGGLSLADGTLYIADAGRPATASSGSVRAIPVADSPAN